MAKSFSRLRIRFVDDELQKKLIAAIAEFRIVHEVGKDGCILYPLDDHSRVERRTEEVLDSHFAVWRKFRCRSAVVDECREYMLRHKIAFVEEQWNDVTFFAISVDDHVPPEFTGPASK